MAFATVEDMQLALGEQTLRAISDHSGAGQIDDAVAARALEEATAMVSTYLDEEPGNPPPIVLRRVTIDVAQMYLRQARDLVTEDSRASYAQAMRWLEQLAAGKIQLSPAPVDPGADPGYLVTGDPETGGRIRLWTQKSGTGVF